MSSLEQRKATPAVEATRVTHTYTSGVPVRALADVSLTLDQGSFTAIMGPSGSGKSTLLHCMAGLERPTSGMVHIGGEPMSAMDTKELHRFRRRRIGFIFQQSNLLPTLTAAENIAIPANLDGRYLSPQTVQEALAHVGLADRAGHRPHELSGGQQQRVAIARALINSPDIIFADEPTAALDSHSSTGVLNLLRSTVDTTGHTIAMVTHDPAVAAYADRVLFLADGQLAGELQHPTAETVSQRMTILSTLG